MLSRIKKKKQIIQPPRLKFNRGGQTVDKVAKARRIK